jgi:hypothetical protein
MGMATIWERGFGDSTTTEQEYKVGTLVVDLCDAKTKQLIFLLARRLLEDLGIALPQLESRCTPRAQTVHLSTVFSPFGLTLNEEQIPQIVENNKTKV